jgi:hypothetical protein
VDRPVLRIPGQVTVAQTIDMLARLASYDGSEGES